MSTIEETFATAAKKSVTDDDLRIAANKFNEGISQVPKQSFKQPPILPKPNEKNVLITSALPYVNNVPHLGTIIGCVLSGDVFARYCRLRGYNTLYICGTDEYGTATETKAIEEGVTPQEICDKYFKIHKDVYDWFNISFDYFGRTTTPHQTKIAQDIFLKLHQNGYTFNESMDQLFCENCKRFLADRFVEGGCPHCSYDQARGDQCDKCGKLINATELHQPRCKLCQKEPVLRSSEHIFLNLPSLETKLVNHLESQWNREDCRWSHNAKGITNGWLKDLKPRCVTRDLKWGTPVPLDNYRDKVFYVWYDAPIGYISITANYTDQWEKWWKNPNEVEYYNFLGKDNVVFHSIIFPACLLGTGENYTVVNQMSATEYLNYEGEKFSKSRNIGVFGSDAKNTGIPSDIWRFYLLFVRPETSDTSFNWDDFSRCINAELVNNIGNFAMRALAFINKSFDSKISKITLDEKDINTLAEINLEINEYISLMDSCKSRDALKTVSSIGRIANQYFHSNEPWALVKGNAEQKARAGSVVSLAANINALLSILLQPFLPETSAVLRKQLALPANIDHVLPSCIPLILPEGHKIGNATPLFQSLDPAFCEEYRQKFCGKSVEQKAAPSASVKNTPAAKQPNSPKKQAKKSNSQQQPQQQQQQQQQQHRSKMTSNNVLVENDKTIAKSLKEIEDNLNNLLTAHVANEERRLIEENMMLQNKNLKLMVELMNAESRNGKKQFYDYSKAAEVSNSTSTISMDLQQNGIDEKEPKAPNQKEGIPNEGTSNNKKVEKSEKKSEKVEREKKSDKSAGQKDKGSAGGDEVVDVSRLDMRVGRIVKATKHPDADSLYVEEVDLGEDKPRTVVSGLVKHIPIEEMQNRLAILLCNLKPAKMRGVESQAMVMCASTPEKVEILNPPEGSAPGDRLFCEGFNGAPDAQLNPKKKTWEQIQPDLTVDDEGRATYKGVPWQVTGKGFVLAPSLRKVPIK